MESIETYQCNPHMYPSIRQKPEHSGPLVRKHMRVLPRGLGFLLGLRKRGPGVQARHAAGIEAGGMRRWAEFIRRLENDGFGLR